MTSATFQLVTFRLAGIPDAAYLARAERAAPVFATMPGLLSKLWLRDPATGTYGGAYAWRDGDAMTAYLDGDVYAGMRADPALVDVTSRHFAVLQAPTAITRRTRVAVA